MLSEFMNLLRKFYFMRAAARSIRVEMLLFLQTEAADESLRLLRACGNIHEDMHKSVDKFEDGTFLRFSFMVT